MPAEHSIGEWNSNGTAAWRLSHITHQHRLCLQRFVKASLQVLETKQLERMFVRKEDVKCERVRGAGGGGALTVTETALASPPGLLSGRACAGLSACLSSPCLVFSLRPSACSLYTASCSGLTCFLYIDIFIATQTPRLPPPALAWWMGGQ